MDDSICNNQPTYKILKKTFLQKKYNLSVPVFKNATLN